MKLTGIIEDVFRGVTIVIIYIRAIQKAQHFFLK